LNEPCPLRRRLLTEATVAIACAASVVFGCKKQDGPTRFEVSGRVTFRGQPVAVGTIAFEPDARRGRSGPAGYADIRDGRYRTHIGVIGGPHIARINGASGPVVDEAKDTTLASDFTTNCDLPMEPTTIDFDITAPVKRSRR
jgi:hypothetical protein